MAHRDWMKLHTRLWDSTDEYTEPLKDDLLYSFHTPHTYSIPQLTKKRLVVLLATCLLTAYRVNFEVDKTGRSNLLFDGVPITAKNSLGCRQFSELVLTDFETRLKAYRFKSETRTCLPVLLTSALFICYIRYMTLQQGPVSGDLDAVIKGTTDVFWKNL